MDLRLPAECHRTTEECCTNWAKQSEFEAVTEGMRDAAEKKML